MAHLPRPNGASTPLATTPAYIALRAPPAAPCGPVVASFRSFPLFPFLSVHFISPPSVQYRADPSYPAVASLRSLPRSSAQQGALSSAALPSLFRPAALATQQCRQRPCRELRHAGSLRETLKGCCGRAGRTNPMKAHSPYLPPKHTPHPLRPSLPTKQPNRCTCLAINNINHTTSRLLVYRESCATHNYKQRRPPAARAVYGGAQRLSTIALWASRLVGLPARGLLA